MLQLKNNSPFAADIALLPNEKGVDTLYIIVKATFNIGRKWTLADEQPPPVEADEYREEPGESSLTHASDYHLGKPASDIVVLGDACAPEGKPVKQLDVDLKVGSIGKSVRVYGDRQWRDGRVTGPEPFERMPLIYERAFGGTRLVDDQVAEADTRNPVGTGFAGGRDAGEMDGVALPNLEHPEYPIGSVGDTPPPAGFGAIAPNWRPRMDYAGTYDEAWQKQRAPYLPDDFDSRFFNTAHPDLVYPGYLQGGEPVRIDRMHPGGPLSFRLPAVKLSTRIDIAGRVETPAFNLETLLLEPGDLRVGLTWRAALVCDKQALKVRRVTVNLSR